MKITAVYKPSFSFKKLFSCCFEVNSEENGVSAVKMQITMEEDKNLKKVTIKGLSGVFV